MKFDEFKSKIDHYNKTVKTLRGELAGHLKATLQGLLDELPNVESFVFEAYTPYFNDGEPCVYTVHGPRVHFKQMSEEVKNSFKYGIDEDGISRYCLDTTGWGKNLKFTNPVQAPIAEPLQTLSERIESIPKDVLLAAFDDHKRIRVSRQKVEVEDYDHE
jgi:hypothetical protein